MWEELTTAAKAATAQTTAAVVERITRSPVTGPPHASSPGRHRRMMRCAVGSPSRPCNSTGGRGYGWPCRAVPAAQDGQLPDLDAHIPFLGAALLYNRSR